MITLLIQNELKVNIFNRYKYTTTCLPLSTENKTILYKSKIYKDGRKIK